MFKGKQKNWETDKSYFHLPHQAKKNNKINKISFELPQGLLESDFNILQAWSTVFTFYKVNLTKFEN